MGDSDQGEKAPSNNNFTEENERKPFDGIGIIGINLVVLIVYTVLCKMVNSLDSLVLEALIIGLQVFVCIVMAIVKKSGMWLLSGLLVLVIGFSTCVGLGNMR